MVKDLRSENDNLKEWRNKKKALTEQLLARAIQELQNLNAKINQKNVCEMMEKLSTSKDKEYDAVITPSAISKNEVYKNMILEANENSEFKNSKNKKYNTDGDKQFEVFKQGSPEQKALPLTICLCNWGLSGVFICFTIY